MFTLHPRLKADTIFIQKLEVSSLYLLNDSRYPWVVIVPERENLSELHDLEPMDYASVMDEVRHLSQALSKCFNPKKGLYRMFAVWSPTFSHGCDLTMHQTAISRYMFVAS